MSSKTADIELEMLCALDGGPMTLAELEAGGWFGWSQPTARIRPSRSSWYRAMPIRAVGCDQGHSHDGACVVEVA